MMLGTPARSSIAVAIGRLRRAGDSSVRKKATPKLIGTPIRSAMKELSIVPMIGDRPPKFSVTGFQDAWVKKANPNFRKAGAAPKSSETMIAPSSSRTRPAKPRVMLRNTTSPTVRDFCVGSAAIAGLKVITAASRADPILIALALTSRTARASGKHRPAPFASLSLHGARRPRALPGIEEAGQAAACPALEIAGRRGCLRSSPAYFIAPEAPLHTGLPSL